MDIFELQLLDKTYHIELKEDQTFNVLHDGVLMGSIYPEAGDLAIEWRSKDKLAPAFVRQLGEQLTKYQLERDAL